MLIKARNLLDTQSLYSFLSDDVASAAVTIPVQNINSYYANWAVQFGKTGEEKSEILLINSSAPSGTTFVTTSGARFAHPTDTPVYAIKYDKVIFKRSTTGTAGTASAMTSGTVSIMPDSLYTEFDDTSAVSTYAYKACYYNSVTGDVSSDSDWITTSGYSFYSLSKIRDRIKGKIHDPSYIADETIYTDWVNEWLEKMNNHANKVNKDYGLGTATVTFGTDGLATITENDFVDLRKVEVTYNGSNYYLANKIEVTDFTDNDLYSSALPKYYYKGDNIIGFKPEESGGTARIIYTTIRTVLASDTDELPVVMRPYSKSFVNYGIANAYYLDKNAEMGDRFMAMADKDRLDFISEITPRSKSGVQTIQVIEGIDGDDNNYIEVF